MVRQTGHYIIQLLFVILLMGTEYSLGQNVIEKNKESQLFVKAKYANQKIIVRWVPNNAASWLKANKIGYNIYRIEVQNNGVDQRPYNKVKINDQPILPYTEEYWEKAIGKDPNSYQIGAMQGYFGYGMTNYIGQNNKSWITQNKVDKDRFGLTMYAADIDKVAAKALGLSFIDSNVSKNRRYYYQVTLANNDETILKSNSTIVDTYQEEKLPKISSFDYQPGDKVLALKWAIYQYAEIFSAYEIQKSESKLGPFIPLKGPYIVPTFEKGIARRFMTLIDSVNQNEKPYYYRIRGIDFYGDWSPFSEVITAESRNLFTDRANLSLLSAEVVHNKEVHLNWIFNEFKRAKSYEILRGTKPMGPFKIIKSINEPLQENSYIDKSPIENGYYKIKAIDLLDRTINSIARFAPLIDNIPPPKPKFKKGIIDTIGHVSLSWYKSTAKDLKAFRLFRKFREEEEYVEVVQEHIKDTSFVDQINLQANPKYVYYQLMAYDERFNESEDSETLQLRVPDKKPPIKPIIQSLKQINNAIQLTIQLSDEEDLKELEILKKNDSSDFKVWKRIKLNNQNDDLLIVKDEGTIERNVMEYKLILYDESNNISESNRMKINIVKAFINKSEVLDFSILKHQNNRGFVLAWEKINGIDQVAIYKRIVGKDWRRIFLDRYQKNQYLDSFVSKGIEYEYRIQGLGENQGGFSKSKKVRF